MLKDFYILALDGGGIRGYGSTLILEHVEKIIETKITEKFGLIAGTSTGGIIASALATPSVELNKARTASEVKDLYKQMGPKIFPKLFRSNFGDFIESFVDIFISRHSNNSLLAELQKAFGKSTLSSTIRPILIPSYDLKTGNLLSFSTRATDTTYGYKNYALHDVRIVDVCMATSAAPTYMPAWQMTYAFDQLVTVYCIDGGIYLNNPILGAVLEFISNPLYYIADDNISNVNIKILSIGTGRLHEEVNLKKALKGKGQLFWGKTVLDLSLTKAAQVYHNASNIFLESITKGKIIKSYKIERIEYVIEDHKLSRLDNTTDIAFKHIESMVDKYVLEKPQVTQSLKSFFI